MTMQAFLAALLLAAGPAAGADGVSGLYQIRQMEMGGGLELTPDGRFRYALDYGAASEQAEGRWVTKNDSIMLTSDPMPKAPSFDVVKDESAPPGELWVQLAPPGFGDFTTNLEMLVTFRDGTRRQMHQDGDGHVPVDVRIATTIQLIVPIYGDVTAPIKISPGQGHRLTLRFMPNDLGKARLDGEPLRREGDTLVLQRYDAKIVFKRVQRAPSK
jgi:hypothetical protein